MKHPSLPAIEPLEARIAPAGVVAVAYNAATGELTLTGDAAANEIHVFKTGTNTHRIEGLNSTTLTGGVSVQDIGKLTKLTIVGGDGDDRFTLRQLSALTALSFDAGPGVGGNLTAIDTTVKGNVVFTGGGGRDDMLFLGRSTLITGNVTVTDPGGGDSALGFGSSKTVVGGSVLYTGGTGFDTLGAGNGSVVSIGKGVNFNGGAGGGGIGFTSDGGATQIGKLPTGESVLVTGGSGYDFVNFSGKSVTLAGGIRMTGGGNLAAGSDGIGFSDAGVVKIGKLPTGQSILLDSGAGNGSISAQAVSFTAAGSIEFNAGPGFNTLSLGDYSGTVAIGKNSAGQSIKFTGVAGFDNLSTDAARLTLAGGIEFAVGDGANSLRLNSPGGAIRIGKLPSGASIKYTGGTSTDEIVTDSARLALAGGIDFAGGAGANRVALAGLSSATTLGKLNTGESLKYVGTTGTDDFTTDLALLTTAGGISFAGGDGVNGIDFGGSEGAVKLGKLATGQSLLYVGGAADDDVESQQGRLSFAGGIEFSGGDGTNTIDIRPTIALGIGSFATGQSVKFAGGSGMDTVELSRPATSLKGSVEMTGGDGANTVFFTGASTSIGKNRAGDSVVLLGTGAASTNEIDLRDTVSVAGSLRLEAGTGAAELSLFGLNALKVGGNVTMIGGPAADSFHVDAFALQIAGNVTADLGAGTDTFTLSADGTIGGNVNVVLGGAATGDQKAELFSNGGPPVGTAGTLTPSTGRPFGLTVKGALTVKGTGDAASTDAVTLQNLIVGKAILADLGEGVSTVAINNLRAADTLTINTNDGADLVAIERGSSVERFVGNAIIAKLATIQTGAGNDIVLIGYLSTANNSGAGDSTRVRFLGGLTADGGTGPNTRNDFAAQNDITGAPTITNFAAVTSP